MRTNIFRILLVTLVAFALFGCQEEKKATTPIAVIDQTKIFEQSANIKAAREHGDAFLEKLNQEMVVLKELAEKEKDSKKAQKMIEEGTLEIQQRLQAEDYLITTKISELFEGAVKEVKEEIGATIVISADLVMSYDEKADITSLIVAKIDKTAVDFADKPVDGEKAVGASAEKTADQAPEKDKAEETPDQKADKKANSDKKPEADKKADAPAKAADDKKTK